MKTRIEVFGNGCQAPYGIGEIINDFANTEAGLKKAMRLAAYWYTPASIRMPEGEFVDIDWDIIRNQDRGYSLS